MIAFIQRWAITILCAALAASLAFGGIQSWRIERMQKEAAQALAKATQDAREKEQNWQADTLVAEEVQREELDAIRSGHLSDNARLRDKYANLSKTAGCASDAAGAPAIALSEPSALRIVAIGADADSVAADLRACQSYVRAVTR